MADILAQTFQVEVLASTMLGIFAGMLVGAIPGLTATMAVALLIPVTFGMSGAAALILLGTIYTAATYGGSFSAILFHTPGTPSSAATCLDGYEMTRKGEAGKALTISTISSALGGLVGVCALLLIAPPLSLISLKFGPLEYFLLAVFGLSIIGGLASNNLVKGLIAGLLGLALSTIGLDPMAAFPRFTFGLINLESGIPLVPALIGMFSVSQAMILAETGNVVQVNPTAKAIKITLPTWQEMKCIAPIIGYCSLIGTFIGILPGAGGDVATWVSYNEARRISKHPEKFGTGIVEGIAASESANNAVCASAMIPLLTLGIPGSNVTAVMLGGLLIHGLVPGRDLFSVQATTTYAIIVGLFLANILMGVIGLLIAPYVQRLARIPYQILASTIILFGVVGSFAINNNFADVYLMMIFGLFGYLMRRYDFPVAATILGLILGPMAENGLRQAMVISSGNLLVMLLRRPISLVIVLVTLLSILWPVLSKRMAGSKPAHA
ncbi:tripartite tricarboxylate transporter permease [Gelria sp. Kuro-4]|uniref:tripartite tricarboxylate transporter permease n=1 Tax=Gelria sp. Kuro-4 TaxID=2796927 RepID=UPI001BF0B0A1|nr:tripartite tricarboxylate transporter permease [Gelria sp. Kuro-4]BCV24897.1 C4-dicarboxylate ABC transporter permease [Gelria sp. Kuro-4]